MIFHICFPHEAFAMAPPKDYFTVVDYYGNKQYMGKDAYGHFNCSVKPYDLENTSWAKSKNPDYILPDTSKSGYIKPNSTTYELDAKPSNHASQYKHEHEEMHFNKKKFYELDGKTLSKQVCKPEHKELHLWTRGLSLRGANPVIYELPPKVDVTFELDADYYEDTISTNLDSTRFNEAAEFVRNYKGLVDHPTTKHSVLSNLNLSVGISRNNIVFIYLKFQEIGRRKVLWNIWERHNSKYESYKHFKRSWDSSTSIWSKIRKDVRENIRSEVEDLLGVKKINRNLKRSVKIEVEKLLRDARPFGK